MQLQKTCRELSGSEIISCPSLQSKVPQQSSQTSLVHSSAAVPASSMVAVPSAAVLSAAAVPGRRRSPERTK